MFFPLSYSYWIAAKHYINLMANSFKKQQFNATCFSLHNAINRSENLNQPDAFSSSSGEET